MCPHISYNSDFFIIFLPRVYYWFFINRTMYKAWCSKGCFLKNAKWALSWLKKTMQLSGLHAILLYAWQWLHQEMVDSLETLHAVIRNYALFAHWLQGHFLIKYIWKRKRKAYSVMLKVHIKHVFGFNILVCVSGKGI